MRRGVRAGLAAASPGGAVAESGSVVTKAVIEAPEDPTVTSDADDPTGIEQPNQV
jgi:hypothetical protein